MAAQNSREIILNVYDFEGEGTGGSGFMKALGLGTYHSGVEISGAEWTFSSGAGVFFHKPKTPAVGRGQSLKLKESILMGVHVGSANDVSGVINRLRDEFRPMDYNIVTRNCNHFSSELCKALIGEDIPAWVNRPAKLGSWFMGGGSRPSSAKEEAKKKEKKAKGPAGAKKELTDKQKAALAALKGGASGGGGGAAEGGEASSSSSST